jgi:hypothetical protein
MERDSEQCGSPEWQASSDCGQAVNYWFCWPNNLVDYPYSCIYSVRSRVFKAIPMGMGRGYQLAQICERYGSQDLQRGHLSRLPEGWAPLILCGLLHAPKKNYIAWGMILNLQRLKWCRGFLSYQFGGLQVTRPLHYHPKHLSRFREKLVCFLMVCSFGFRTWSMFKSTAYIFPCFLLKFYNFIHSRGYCILSLI